MKLSTQEDTTGLAKRRNQSKLTKTGHKTTSTDFTYAQKKEHDPTVNQQNLLFQKGFSDIKQLQMLSITMKKFLIVVPEIIRCGMKNYKRN